MNEKLIDVKFKISAIFNNAVHNCGWTYAKGEKDVAELQKLGWIDEIKTQVEASSDDNDIAKKITNKEQSFLSSSKNKKR